MVTSENNKWRLNRIARVVAMQEYDEERYGEIYDIDEVLSPFCGLLQLEDAFEEDGGSRERRKRAEQRAREIRLEEWRKEKAIEQAKREEYAKTLTNLRRQGQGPEFLEAQSQACVDGKARKFAVEAVIRALNRLPPDHELKAYELTYLFRDIPKLLAPALMLMGLSPSRARSLPMGEIHLRAVSCTILKKTDKRISTHDLARWLNGRII